MQKRALLRLVAAVTLLMSPPAPVHTAPLISEVPHLPQVPLSLNGGDQTPPDPWTSGPDIQELTATVSVDQLPWTGPVMTHSNGHGKTHPQKPAKSTNSPSYLVKTLALTNNVGRKLKTVPETINVDGLKKRRPTINPVTGKMEGYATMKGNKQHKQLKTTPVTAAANKQDKIMQPARRAKMNPDTSSQDRREIMKLLSTLEEIQRSMNSHIIIIPRGNSNGGSSGKKRKMAVTERNIRPTTVSSVVSTAGSEPRLLDGKGLKKSLPSTTKKTNKRVCFWKYCSQN
ncbi:urotensin II-related peptide [Brachyhypopomus gauderio]|uniref:urotensin II-related peptide n=1 Tax=Brachyhypopomus gauderio TaxID=698409 RepID=UPI004041413F